jgi:hypothetical protein
MALGDIRNADSVLQAVREFDRLGQEGFLKKYGFRRAREYVLVVEGKHYDSKAIVGAAHGYEFPEDGPLGANDFTGGDATVRPKLESLGFTVVRLGGARTRTWIFQANPDVFDVDGYLRVARTPTWTVRQENYAPEMASGDRVFLWRAKGRGTKPAGIVASGHLTGEAEHMPGDPEATPFWKDPQPDIQLCVPLRLDRTALGGAQVLDRETLKNHPVLGGLHILGYASQTNYRVSPEHARHLEQLWSGVAPRIVEEPSAGVAQGYEPDAKVRKAIEDHAMALATAHYESLGSDVEVTASRRPYDLACTREGSEEIRVEVKGTRGDGDSVELTIGEVENARGTGWRTDLFIVSGIRVTRTDDGPVASGGTHRVFEQWCPADEELSPTRFRCRVPR